MLNPTVNTDQYLAEGMYIHKYLMDVDIFLQILMNFLNLMAIICGIHKIHYNVCTYSTHFLLKPYMDLISLSNWCQKCSGLIKGGVL